MGITCHARVSSSLTPTDSLLSVLSSAIATNFSCTVCYFAYMLVVHSVCLVFTVSYMCNVMLCSCVQ